MPTPPELRTFLLEHDGVVAATDARKLGLERQAIHRLVRAGTLLSVARGLYRSADHPMTTRTRMRLATLSVGARAVLSGHAAAWWHGIAEMAPSTIAVTAPRGRSGPPIDGVRITTRDLDPADVVTRRDLLVCAVPLASLEAALESGATLLDAALLRGRVSVDQLNRTFERRRHHDGAARMAMLIAGVAGGARSVAERELARILRRAKVDGWTANYRVGRYVVDAAFPDRCLIIEIDGMAYHRDAHAFQYDRTRRNDLIADGWTVLNFTWWDLIERPDEVIARIRRALNVAA
ncbi:type IV toxin-antitoxin system AbiEi family antitoxin domain-containing protein [Gordonia sinesedis]